MELLQTKSRSGSELLKGTANDKPHSPGAGLGSKLKDILKKVRQSGEFGSEDDDSRPSSRGGDGRKKVSINEITDSAPFTPLREKSLRQKMIEDENQRLGKAKSLGFTSIKAGLGRKEYEDFIKKSPVKPLALRMLENTGAAAGGGRRSILVRMKTESSINGIILPPLSKSGRDLVAQTARSENGIEGGGGGSISSLESTDRPLLRKSGTGLGGFLSSQQPLQPLTSPEKTSENPKTNLNNDDYSKEDFESSIDSGKNSIKEEEEQMAREANKPQTPAIAAFLLKELQAEDMIERRFGWKRTGNSAAAHDSRIDFLSMANGISKSTSDQDIPYKRPIVKLGEISPMGSMRQSVRGTLFAGKAPAPGKLTRKATMANLTGPGAAVGAGGPGTSVNPTAVPEIDPFENIHEHYCGLLYRDPHSNNTWKDVNSPKKAKGFFASQQSNNKQNLAAGRNINAYRPWGPPRPVDPLDAILEQSITKSYESSIEYDDYDESDRPSRPSSRGRKRSGGSRRGRNSSGNRKSSSNNNHSSSNNNRSLSPFSSQSPKQSVGRSPSASRSRVSSAENHSKSRGRSPKQSNTPQLEQEKYRSGLTLELSQEITRPRGSSSSPRHHSARQSSPTHHRPDSRASSDHHPSHHESSHPHSPSEEINRSTSTVDDSYDQQSPSHSATKKRSPLVINFVKVPVGWSESL